MSKVTLIIKETFYDDVAASSNKSIKVCESIAQAKENVLNELKTDFNDEGLNKCATLEEASEEMSTWDYNMYCDNRTFSWEENCKGETYEFIEIDTECKDYQY